MEEEERKRSIFGVGDTVGSTCINNINNNYNIIKYYFKKNYPSQTKKKKLKIDKIKCYKKKCKKRVWDTFREFEGQK